MASTDAKLPLSYFQRLPKIELHLHLEGAIPLLSLWELIEKYGGDPNVPSVEALTAKFAYRDFAHFIDVWIWKNQFLREYEDFTFIAAEVARSLVAQNVVYAEAFYSPDAFGPRGLTPQGITQAIRKGLNQAPAIEVALILDFVRDNGPTQAQRTLDALREVAAENNVVGIGIGGSEQRYPPEPFSAVYENARRLGFRTNAHAGEASGPQSVWGALRALRVDRIGHGTRAIEDPELLDHLAEQRIPLELCIFSNLRTGVIRSVEAHPVRTYFERGIPISLNTDDPTLFNNTLAEEYFALHAVLGFNRAEVHRVIEDSVDSAWLPSDRRRALLQRIRAGIQSEH